MNFSIHYILTALTFCLISLTTCQITNSNRSTPSSIVEGSIGVKLDSLLTPYVKELRNKTDNKAGLAIAVTKGKDIVFAKSFGYADINTKSKVDLNTQFLTASLTKPFTTFAALKLVEKGKLQISDPIIKYLPELKNKNKQFGAITIQHLMTHTSGIPKHVNTDDWHKPVIHDKALEQNLKELLNFELLFNPGSQFQYSDAGIDILALIIERISGKSFFDFSKENIFHPIGMENTHFRKESNTIPHNWANTHTYGFKTEILQPYPYNLKVAPSSGLRSSVLDMCKWSIMHLGNGVHDKKVILKESLFKEMIKPQFETPWGDDIGLTWFLQEYLERPIIMHTGASHGFESMIYIYPHEDISIVVLANRSNSRTGRIVNAASEIIFDAQLKPYSTSAIYNFTNRYKLGGIDAAKEYWEEAKKDTTDAHFAYDDDILSCGSTLELLQKWEETKDVLEYYLTLNERSTYALRLLGNAYLNLGDTAQAKSCYKETLKINPEYLKGKIALQKLNLVK